MNVCSHSLLGDNINKLGRNNNTPLHYACSQNRVQVVEYIICIHYEFSIEKCLVHGGNPHAVNSQGKNPYDLTADTHFTLKQMLLKYMYQTPEGQSMQPQLDTVTGFTQAKEEAEDRLHISHVNRPHHTRHRDKSHTREGGAHHTNGDNVPRRLSIAEEKSLVAIVAPRDPCDE